MAAFDPLSANPTKWSNSVKQFVGKLPTNCLSVFDHFVNLALKGLKTIPLNIDTSYYLVNMISVKDQVCN